MECEQGRGASAKLTLTAIPALLHQTWATSQLPGSLDRLVATWRQHHPHWTIKFYDDEEARMTVARVLPEALALYDDLALSVLRADLFRYIVLFAEGGVYADVDMECLRPLDRFLKAGRLTLSIEASLDPRRAFELGYRRPFQLANCILAAPPGDRFLGAFIEALLADAPRLRAARRRDVEDVTGPRRLTRFFYAAPAAERAALRILPQVFWMAPLEYPAWLFPTIHARHLCLGSWKLEEPMSLRERWYRRNRWPAPWPQGNEPFFLD